MLVGSKSDGDAHARCEYHHRDPTRPCLPSTQVPQSLLKLLSSYAPAASPSTCVAAAMSSVDSKAVFAARVRQLGLGEHLPTFLGLHWTTHAELAFASSSRPGQDNAAFEGHILVPGLGYDAHPLKHILRRLYYESFAMASAEIRRLQEPNAAEVPRVVPQPEREARRTALAARLVGLSVDGMLVGEYDVADRLIDRTIHIYEADSLAYIGLDLCTKRDFEVLGHKKDPYLAPYQDVNGYLKMESRQPETYCALGTQTLFENAFMRRNLAMDMGDVMSFEVGEQLRRTLIAALTEDVPPGHTAVSLNQLIAADKKFWVTLASAVRGGVKRGDLDERPCDKAAPKILNSVPFNLMLAPRALAAVAPAHAPAPQQLQGPSKKDKEVIKRQEKQERARAAREQADRSRAANQTKGGDGGRSAKGKGAAKGSNAVRMPAGLEGMVSKTSAATGMRRLCFGYNLGSCSAAAPGEMCFKGLHGCMKPVGPNNEACGERHPASACTK